MTQEIVWLIIGIIAGGLISIVTAYFTAYFTVLFTSRKEDNKIKKVRDIAVKGLNILIENHKKQGDPYTDAENEFNKKLSTTDKRAVLVSLAKIGVPFDVPIDMAFEINNIEFEKGKEIDPKELKAMIDQIESGHCDNLFFEDVESFFSKDTRIKALRSIAKRYVNEVLKLSTIYWSEDETTWYIKPPDGWLDRFSYGEWNVLFVFKSQLLQMDYFNKGTKKSNEGAISKLINEIEIGLWDTYLFWDKNAYENLIIQNQSLNVMSLVYKYWFNDMNNKSASTNTEVTEVVVVSDK
jgi:hypothetical protein